MDHTQYPHILKYSDNAPNKRPLFQSSVDMPEYGSRRYYSSSDVEIYFGSYYVDEATAIMFEVSESSMMLFGYNSYVFDGIAKGSRLIQGQFSINFTRTNYLSEVLNTLSTLEGMGKIKQSKYSANWPTGFDIYLSYGDGNKSSYQMLTLESAYITGVKTQVDSRSGEPIAEIYSFIARDLLNDYEAPEAEPIIPNVSEYEDLELVKASYDAAHQKITVLFNHTVQFTDAKYAINRDNLFRSIPGANKTQDYIEIFINPLLLDHFKNTDFVPVTLKAAYIYQEKSYTEDFSFTLYLKESEGIV